MKKRKLWTLLLAAILLLSGCALGKPEETVAVTHPPEPTYKPLPQGTFLETYVDEPTGRTIDYHLYIPENATEHMPLVIFLHGVGAVGSPVLNQDNPMIHNARAIYGEEFPFLILAPTCNYSSWLSKEMPQRLKDLIDFMVSEYGINQDKIIITGHSMGSTGVFRMVQLYGDFFSAAVPVSDPDVSLIEPESCLNVPIWAFAGGLEQPFNHYIRDICLEIEALGGDIRYTEIPDVKHGNTPYHAFAWDLFHWALEQ